MGLHAQTKKLPSFFGKANVLGDYMYVVYIYKYMDMSLQS